MIVLKTKSQVKNFYKRASVQYNHSYNEGCGCCYGQSTVEIDNKRIVLHTFNCVAGSFYSNSKVLAVIKKTVEIITLKVM